MNLGLATYTWTYAWDPLGGSGFGQLTVDIFIGDSLINTGIVTLTSEDRSIGATMDSFGLFAGTSPPPHNSHPYTMYVDNLAYTVVPIPGDVNHDGVVDIGDMAIAGNQWGTDGSGHPFGWNADIAPMPGGDGVVDVGDLAAIGFNWTPLSGSTSLNGSVAVPVPSVFFSGLGLLGGIGLVRRRR